VGVDIVKVGLIYISFGVVSEERKSHSGNRKEEVPVLALGETEVVSDFLLTSGFLIV